MYCGTVSSNYNLHSLTYASRPRCASDIHTWGTKWCPLALQSSELKHNRHARRCSIKYWILTGTEDELRPTLQLHGLWSADAFQILPHQKEIMSSFSMNGDLETEQRRRLNWREWSIPSLTSCISPSLALLRTLPVPTVHPFQQRWPTTYAHFQTNTDLCIGSSGVSYLACYTKLVFIDMKQHHLFNTDSEHWA